MFFRTDSSFNRDGFSIRGQASPAVLLLVGMLGLAGLFFGQFIATAPAAAPLVMVIALFVFGVAFFRMDLALVFVILAMLLSPEISAGAVGTRAIAIRIEDVLIVVLGIAWFAKASVLKGLEIIPHTSLNAFIGIYIGCFFISTFQGIITIGGNPFKAMFYALKYLEYFILFFLVAGTVRRRKTAVVFITALLITFFVVNVYAFTQIGTGRVSAPFEGPSGEPNTLGGYQVLMLCVTLGILCHASSKTLSVLLSLLALSCIWPFLHTLSRASYVALVPAYLALVFYCRTPRKIPLIMIMLLAVSVGLLFMPEPVKERLAYTFNAPAQAGITPVKIFGLTLDPSSSTRWLDWLRAFDYWKAAPFFGYGLAGVSFLDSQYVNNMIELGAFGFVSFALLVWFLHRQTIKVYRNIQDPLGKGLALGFAAGNIGMIVHALTANTFILIRIMEPYWLIAALIMVWPRIEALSQVNTGEAYGGSSTASAEEPVVRLSEKSTKRVRNVDMLLKDRNIDGT